MMDGYIVYHGKAISVPNYFTKCGYKFPKFANPADFLMKIVQVTYPKSFKDEKTI